MKHLLYLFKCGFGLNCIKFNYLLIADIIFRYALIVPEICSGELSTCSDNDSNLAFGATALEGKYASFKVSSFSRYSSSLSNSTLSASEASFSF